MGEIRRLFTGCSAEAVAPAEGTRARLVRCCKQCRRSVCIDRSRARFAAVVHVLMSHGKRKTAVRQGRTGAVQTDRHIERN